MDGTTTVLLVIGLTVAVLAGPLSAVSTRAADGLLERGTYQRAVLEEAAP